MTFTVTFNFFGFLEPQSYFLFIDQRAVAKSRLLSPLTWCHTTWKAQLVFE